MLCEFDGLSEEYDCVASFVVTVIPPLAASKEGKSSLFSSAGVNTSDLLASCK